LSQLRLTDFRDEEPQRTAQEKETAGVRLRPYQEEAYQAWVERGRRGVVVAPTGTGKTVIAAYAIKTSGLPTLVIVPTERILKTWITALARFGLRATAYYGREKSPSPLTISIYNSVVRHPEIVDRFGMVVLDEVHHAAASVFRRILDLVGGRAVMALTATLRRGDGRHTEIVARLPVVYTLDLKTAIERGYVSPIDIVPIPAPLTSQERMLYNDVELRIRRVRAELAAAKASSSSYLVERLDRRLKILLNERRQLLSKIPSKRARVLGIVKNVDDDRVIVFSESIESIEELKKYLIENGVSAETYHSQKPESVRDSIFAEWGRGFRVLLAVRALNEGVDVPEVKTGIIIASGKEVRQLVQRQGRLIRPVQGKRARLYVVYAEGTYEYEIFLRLRSLIRGWIRPY
jgi:superfamily II DNA or RNA helicase